MSTPEKRGEAGGNLPELFKQQDCEELNHLFEESAALNVYDKSSVNLAAGAPGPDLLARLPGILAAAAAHRTEAEAQGDCFLFQYGPTAGWSGLRRALAAFLARRYAAAVSASELVLTCGATHGLHLALSTLLAPRAVIFVEEYTYMIALSLFKEFPEYQIIAVPLTEDGLDVDKFIEIAEKTREEGSWDVSGDKPFWAMLYIVPTFHNPTGSLLPPGSCERLAAASRALSVLVLCDDVYNLLHFREEPPRRLYSYSAGAYVISNGSFSKILAPGIRVGWMEMAPALVQRFRKSGFLQSGGSVNNVMFGLVQSVLELGLADRQLDWYRRLYAERMAALAGALRAHLPAGCHFRAADGGYFLWLRLPPGLEGGAFLRWLAARGGPGAVASARFRPAGAAASPALRLSIGFHDAATLAAAARQLALGLRAFAEEC